MHQLVGYHRPKSIAEAVELLARTDRRILAGGTTIRHDGAADPVELVDLQALGLSTIAQDGEIIHLGATVTLEAMAQNELVPELIRRTARAELPSTLRPLATIGGTIGAGESDSVLLAALLVHEAVVHLADDRSLALPTALADGLGSGAVIIGIDVIASGATAMASTARTPADRPIVAALARSGHDGILLALCGVASTPQLVDPTGLDRLDPPADFRGSSAYRRHLARVLSARVLEGLP